MIPIQRKDRITCRFCLWLRVQFHQGGRRITEDEIFIFIQQFLPIAFSIDRAVRGESPRVRALDEDWHRFGQPFGASPAAPVRSVVGEEIDFQTSGKKKTSVKKFSLKTFVLSEKKRRKIARLEKKETRKLFTDDRDGTTIDNVSVVESEAENNSRACRR